jgi:hypothetical protein
MIAPKQTTGFCFFSDTADAALMVAPKAPQKEGQNQMGAIRYATPISSTESPKPSTGKNSRPKCLQQSAAGTENLFSTQLNGEGSK